MAVNEHSLTPLTPLPTHIHNTKLILLQYILSTLWYTAIY